MPSGPGNRRAARPLPLLAAAVLGILLGFYTLLYAVLLFTAARVDGVFAAFGAVYLGITVLCVAGAVQALTGRSGRLLAAGGIAIAVLSVVGIATSLVAGAFTVWPVVLVATGAGVVVLLGRPASREFLARPGS